MDYIDGIGNAFKKYIGKNSVESLQESINQKPMILIAGDQLTGQSTLAKNLAEEFNGTFHSVGNLFPNVNYENLESLREEIINLHLDDGHDVIEKFVENQNRDGDDRARYSSLYGFDYGNLSGYDIVVNTSNKEADQVFSEVVNELEKFGFKIN